MSLCFTLPLPCASRIAVRAATTLTRPFGTQALCSNRAIQSSFLGNSLQNHRNQCQHQLFSVPRRNVSKSRTSMKLNSAIVGLPNVGKSTLFNALVENGAAQAANFPFCTIEPNVGIAVVPDSRLNVLAEMNSSVKTVPAVLEVVDVAGLVAGAAEGEGLGNKFLANIRETDAIVHVVRCFEDDDVIHVSGSVDPVRDIETINLELGLADLGQVERRIAKSKTKSRVKGADDPHEASALEKLNEALNEGRMARSVDLSEEEIEAVRPLGLLTLKPVVYAANVADTELADGNKFVEAVRDLAKKEGSSVVIVSAQVESELVSLDPEERREFLGELGVTEDDTGLRALVRATYSLLGLQTYFTSGPTETKAWTIRMGMKAPQAAGVIHDDFERGFIRAETIAYDKLKEIGSEKTAKEKGLIRSEGKDYVVQDGDVMLFRFNV